MVDCRPAAGAPPHDLAHAAPNGAPPSDTHHNQGGSGGEGGGHSLGSVRASTPAGTGAVTTYTGMSAGTPVAYAGGGACAPYVCGVKSVVWCAPHAPPPPPPPPPGVNPHVARSLQPSGADLPMNDIATLRYYFNLGVECMWAAYGPPPPRRDLAHDLHHLTLNDHKRPQPKAANPPRPLLGPRFKRGGNGHGGNGHGGNGHDGNHNNQNQGKGHNHSMPNKGPGNRNRHAESRAPAHYEAECAEPPLLAMPYLPYPQPPVYPVPYYPVDETMMGMMGGMGYVGYEDGVEYPVPYYGPPHYAPPPHAPPQHAPPPHAPQHAPPQHAPPQHAPPQHALQHHADHK